MMEDAFQLASLVIPALREDGQIDEQAPSHVQEIISATSDLRSDERQTFQGRKAYNSVSYEEERAIYRDGEIYRACLLLHGTGNPGPDAEEVIKRWLLDAPWRREAN